MNGFTTQPLLTHPIKITVCLPTVTTHNQSLYYFLIISTSPFTFIRIILDGV